MGSSAVCNRNSSARSAMPAMNQAQQAVLEGLARNPHHAETQGTPAPSTSTPVTAQPKAQRIRSGRGYFAEPRTPAPPSALLAAWADFDLSTSQLQQRTSGTGVSPGTALGLDRRLGLHVQYQPALAEDQLAANRVDTKV